MQRKHCFDFRVVVFLAAVGLALVLVGCAGTPEPGSGDGSRLSLAQREQAERLYSQLVMEHQLHRDRKTLEIAANLLDYYQGFTRNDEVLDKAIVSAQRLSDIPRARELTTEMLVRFPGSPLLDRALLRGAELAVGAADTLAAARFLVRYHDRDPIRGTNADGTPTADLYLKHLDAPGLALLMEDLPASDLWAYLGYLRTVALLRAGRFGPAESLVERLALHAPQDGWTVAARELLSGDAALPPTRLGVAAGPVESRRIGVLSPLTGRYALLGNAYVDAAILAVEDFNQVNEEQFELQVEDTAGDPVEAALAARRLCSEAGSIAVLGALMSAPTAAAAVVTDLYRVPLVSPTATNDGVWKLGDGIFQTNLTGLYEVRLLAQLATTVLLKERFAVLYPDNQEGRRLADVFATEVEGKGGRIVARASYPDQGTDFKDPILEIRQHRPEVIFAPGTVDQMVMLGPQLDFYRAGSLILGLSNWNADKLLERAGTVLERALLPSDLAMFRAEWTTEFEVRWNDDNYPREATVLALKAYQAARMLLETIRDSGAASRAQLTQALQARLASRDVDAAGPESYAASVRMFRGGRIVSFPSDLFGESWSRTEGALVDSLTTGNETGETAPGGAGPDGR